MGNGRDLAVVPRNFDWERGISSWLREVDYLSAIEAEGQVLASVLNRVFARTPLSSLPYFISSHINLLEYLKFLLLYWGKRQQRYE